MEFRLCRQHLFDELDRIACFKRTTIFDEVVYRCAKRIQVNPVVESLVSQQLRSCVFKRAPEREFECCIQSRAETEIRQLQHWELIIVFPTRYEEDVLRLDVKVDDSPLMNIRKHTECLEHEMVQLHRAILLPPVILPPLPGG